MGANAPPQFHTAHLPVGLGAAVAALQHKRRSIILRVFGAITTGGYVQHKHRASSRHERDLSSAWILTVFEQNGERSAIWLPLRYTSGGHAVVLNDERPDLAPQPDRIVVHLLVNEPSGLSVVPVLDANGLVWEGFERFNRPKWQGAGGVRWNLAADGGGGDDMMDLMLEAPYDDTERCAQDLLLQVLQSRDAAGPSTPNW